MPEIEKEAEGPKRRMIVYFSSLFAAWGFLGLIASFSMVKKPLS